MAPSWNPLFRNSEFNYRKSLIKFKKAFKKKQKQPQKHIGGDKIDKAQTTLAKMKVDKDKIEVQKVQLLSKLNLDRYKINNLEYRNPIQDLNHKTIHHRE